jgi:endo-1,4-beta-mannosidase
MEDLEEDRRLGPAEASECCDLLSMHGYPIYATWANGPTDEHLLAFLAHVTRWLGKGRRVLFSEFGLPTYPSENDRDAHGRHVPSMLVEEATAAAYTHRALAALRAAGCAGAMIWCYTDYDPAIWTQPPLDLAVHERFFGLWRADGTPKPAVAVVEEFADKTALDGSREHPWIDLEPNDFYTDPQVHLRRLYHRYLRS